MPDRIALIFGISGQDGAYLAKLLLDRGYEVHGTSRDREMERFGNLRSLGVLDRVRLHSAVLGDFRSVLQVINDAAPTEIYNLAGQSSVALSFSQPVETIDGIVHGSINIMESIRFLKRDIRFYNAGSSESFGDASAAPSTEDTPFRPRSPYGVAKAASVWAVANYRSAYNLFAASGLLFNHESPFRPARFVTQKVIRGAVDIREGRAEHLKLGNLSVARDWGWAPEYVDAMSRILSADEPEDFVIATGATHTLEEFVAAAFDHVGLRWRDHVEVEPSLMRPTDIAHSAGDPTKAALKLGWRAQHKMHDVVRLLVEAELDRRQRQRLEHA